VKGLSIIALVLVFFALLFFTVAICPALISAPIRALCGIQIAPSFDDHQDSFSAGEMGD